MPRHPIPSLLVALGALLVPGCTNDSTQPTDVPAGAAAVAPEGASTAASEVLALTSASTSNLPPFDPKNFVRVIDNPYFPLQPGTRYVYRGTDGGEPLKDVIDVTNRDKTILGVKVVVVLDRVFTSGALVEKTFDYFAQDKQGNVWYFGEDTKEYEDGKVVSTAGTFQAGKDGATAGIIMRAHPKIGQTTQQEFAPGVAEDKGTVVSLNATVVVPFGKFYHCLETKDFTPLEPGALEIKYYCPGIGFARGRDVSGGSVQMALTGITR